MGIDIKDHRRYAEGKMAEHIKKAEERAKEVDLLPQAPSDFAATGDERLDKVVRAVQEVLNVAEQHANQVAHSGVACLTDEALRKHQAEYFFTQGLMKAHKDVFEIVARVVTEAKQAHSLSLVP